ncbi:MAG: PTS sugar transporter subunit IIA [Desulfobulbaceae bacterium]|nr:PTS sugar transporter subunit IIA [Desulfobulbaceae bacterium]
MRNITEKKIASNLQATSKKEVLHELAELLHITTPNISKAKIFSILQEREKIGSTGIGEGIAIPHGKLDRLDHIEICFGRSINGIPFDATDNKPVHLFFVLLAPTRSSGPYLNTLASLARFLKSPHVRSQLLKAQNANDIVSIFGATGEYI